MFHFDFNKINIYIKPGPTDMRKAINGLYEITKRQMRLYPGSGCLFVFCNRRRDRIKILYWELNGYCLWHKRLEKDKFPWPNSEIVSMEIDEQQLSWLLTGVDFFKKHKERQYD
jgi:transposase